MDDLNLLRRFEPVLRFTQGELFFPCAVDEYIRRCSLWMRDAASVERQLVTEGELSPEKLAHFNEAPANHTLYLRFVDKPLEALDYQRWLRRPDRPSFRAPSRLARVGVFSRLLDSFLDLSLLIRGKVPGGTAAAADIKYRAMQREDPRYVYYGRVIREGGYIVLHYLFFYAMNNWRSNFYGVNDHEADWEQIFVYLSDEGENDPVPLWVAYASHDFSGDDLRRRWDDPELHRGDETHPVVYVGAGSHASYFLPGEYLMGVEPEFLRPVRNALKAIQKFWAETLGQGYADQLVAQVGNMLSVPFVDYARGDGLSVGPGQNHPWTPIVLTEEMGWAEEYRGLWGLDTQDPLGGERAPAGPKYNRDGSVRTAWHNPLGWAGLDKVMPPALALPQLRSHIATLAQEREALERELVHKREEVRLLALEVQALHETDYLSHIHRIQQEQLSTVQSELQGLYARRLQLTETWLASQFYLEKIESRDWGDPQAHIRHRHLPEPPIGNQGRVLELWAAASGGLLLLAFAVLLALATTQWLTWTILIGIVFLAIEATVRGHLSRFLLNVTIVLGLITSLLLIKDFLWLIVILGLFAVVVASIVTNLRELWGR